MMRILVLALILVFGTSCKKLCQEQNYGDLTFRNKAGQDLKVKVNNTIPTGCISENNGFLFSGTECTAQVTGSLQHTVTIYKTTGEVYWQFDMSVGPCGSRIIDIQ